MNYEVKKACKQVFGISVAGTAIPFQRYFLQGTACPFALKALEMLAHIVEFHIRIAVDAERQQTVEEFFLSKHSIMSTFLKIKKMNF